MSYTFKVEYFVDGMGHIKTILAGDAKEARKLTREDVAIKGMKIGKVTKAVGEYV